MSALTVNRLKKLDMTLFIRLDHFIDELNSSLHISPFADPALEILKCILSLCSASLNLSTLYMYRIKKTAGNFPGVAFFSAFIIFLPLNNIPSAFGKLLVLHYWLCNFDGTA